MDGQLLADTDCIGRQIIPALDVRDRYAVLLCDFDERIPASNRVGHYPRLGRIQSQTLIYSDVGAANVIPLAELRDRYIML